MYGMRNTGMPQASLPIGNVLVCFIHIWSDSLCYSKPHQEEITSELNNAGPRSALTADGFLTGQGTVCWHQCAKVQLFDSRLNQLN